MQKWSKTAGVMALAASLSLTGAGVSAAPPQASSQGARCDAGDTNCRLERIEDRIDYLTELLERQASRPGRDRGASRSIDIPVNQSCGMATDGCSTLAAQLCQQGGFGRGVPAETTAGSWTTTLVRATCLD